MQPHMNLKIVKDFKWYYDHGYITARDGNAAYRSANGYVVTASGTVKNKLNYTLDFIEVDKNLNIITPSPFPIMKPSIETGAHVSILEQSEKAVSVHVHSPNTVALAALFEQFGGFRPQSSHLVDVLNSKYPELFRYTKVAPIPPYFDPGTEKLHDSIVNCMGYWGLEVAERDKDGEIQKVVEAKKWNDIIILQRHGVLAIDDSLEECMEHIIRLEHISTILLKIITASGKVESIL